MSVITCFECGKYCIIRDTKYHGNSLECDHKTYRYRRKTSDHKNLEEIPPIQKKQEVELK